MTTSIWNKRRGKKVKLIPRFSPQPAQPFDSVTFLLLPELTQLIGVEERGGQSEKLLHSSHSTINIIIIYTQKVSTYT